MADWYGTSRSNYVKLKPHTIPILEEIFEIKIVTNGDGLSAILSEDQFGDTPTIYTDDDQDLSGLIQLGFEPNEDVTHLTEVIHLCLEPEPGNVFIWISIGAEKARYLTGRAWAIDHTGATVNEVDLNEIYEGLETTRAEY